MNELVSPAFDETKKPWIEAFDLWLKSRPTENTRRSYTRSWKMLMAFTGKYPWNIRKSDVMRFTDYRRSENKSANTILLDLAAISSFYRYAMEVYTVETEDGEEIPLAKSNPGLSVPRPKEENYVNAYCLSSDEARRLLEAIERDTARGKRDYALLLAYLLLGRRNSEIRNFRWGDLFEQDGVVFYRWTGKGKRGQLHVCPTPVWDAILDYLKADDRLSSMAFGDAIFKACSDCASRFPNAKSWDRKAPLSMHEIGRIVKKYAEKAGLDPELIHPHTLRHTAAMLRYKCGDDVYKICEFLGHSSIAVTHIYLHDLTGTSDDSWPIAAGLLGVNIHAVS